VTPYRLTPPDQPARRVAVHCKSCGQLAARATSDPTGAVHYAPVAAPNHGVSLHRPGMMMEPAYDPERDGSADRRPRHPYHQRQHLTVETFSWACPRCDAQLIIRHAAIAGRRIIAALDPDWL
jgi:hypothetical protein